MRTSGNRPSLPARVGLPLILLLCAIQSWRPLNPGWDFWSHAAVGRWISNHGAIPRHSLFVWSAPDFPWVYYSWLCQWLFYKWLVMFGPVGLMVLTTIVVGVVFALLWRLWEKRAAGRMPAVAPLLFFVAILVSSPRFQPRQELFTAVFLALFLTWLTGWNERRADEARNNLHAPLFQAASLGIVALVVLWVNIHPLVMFAMGLLLIACVTDALQYRTDRRARGLLLVTALCCAATLVNPWGLGLWAATGQLKPGGQATHIQEWWPVFKDWPALQALVYAEAILVITALWSWAVNPARRWAELFWVLASTGLFLRSRRLLWILAIVCLVVMASNARSFDSATLWRKWRQRTRQDPEEPMAPGLRFIAHGGILAILLLMVISFAQVFPQNPREFSPLTGVSALAPSHAADYVLKHGVPPRIFTTYSDASYFHWRLNGPDKNGVVPARGRYPLYIDSFNAYPDAALDHYFQILEATPEGRRRLDSLGINTVMLTRSFWNKKLTGKLGHIVPYLDSNPGWKRVFADDDARIWVRRVPRKPAANAEGRF